MRQPPPADHIGAFCRDNAVAMEGAAQGPLRGLTFAAKDLFDIKGVRTGFGQPDWLRTHEPPQATARAVQQLLDAGADMVAKAHCDELCYSLTGENVHFGTPQNVNAPGRVPGGSSNGSAAAVAAGLVDFALGSDCGGSVRIPASYCGVLGLRPTWDKVSLDGAVPFGPSFDVAGFFARDAQTMTRVGRVLLADRQTPRKPRRLILARDAIDRVAPDVRAAFLEQVPRVAALVGDQTDMVISPDGLDTWFEAFRTIQAAEVWASVGPWVTKFQPKLGPGVKERLEWAASVPPQMLAAANAERAKVRIRLADILGPYDMICLPTSPRVAPLRGTPTDKIEVEYRHQAMCLLCISGLTGLPQLSLPLMKVDGLPVGLSLIARHDRDIDLLHMAELLMPKAA